MPCHINDVRSEEGLGLIELNTAFRSNIVSLGQYLISHLLKLVANQHKNTFPPKYVGH